MMVSFLVLKNFTLTRKATLTLVRMCVCVCVCVWGGLKGVGMGCSGCCSKRPLLPVCPLFSSVCILCQSQINELESRPPFKKCGFSGQILLKLMF